ncbi:MAG: AbrB/MazE/SpoVT family DNA-binding domain-containing protein [Treponema sp.]|jgi:antitoxin MazE|nr:AbrB/MazE/SpoVT family DNA-binding domain-containing protein [Treponema sp.]
MLVSVVPIGNSKGIRIPKSIINEFNIEDKLELQIHNDEIILKPIVKKPRQGWEDAFKKMHKNSDDILLLPDSIENDFNWEW